MKSTNKLSVAKSTIVRLNSNNKANNAVTLGTWRAVTLGTWA